MTQRTRSILIIVACCIGVGAALAAAASMIGMLYVKSSETLMTMRAGQACANDPDNFCERTYLCPTGKVAHAMVYNIKTVKDAKSLGGLSLVCSDPNAFDQPSYAGAAGDAFSGEVINDYCPVGYLLAGADFYTTDRVNISGAKRICRRYRPFDERRGPNVFGEGVDQMTNVCPENHWVTGLMLSYSRKKDDGGHIDTTLLNTRFYCSEIRHYLVEPEKEESK